MPAVLRHGLLPFFDRWFGRLACHGALVRLGQPAFLPPVNVLRRFTVAPFRSCRATRFGCVSE